MKKNNPNLYCVAGPVLLAKIVHFSSVSCMMICVILLVIFLLIYLKRIKKQNLDKQRKLKWILLWVISLLLGCLFYIYFEIDLSGYAYYYYFFVILGIIFSFNLYLGQILNLYRFRRLYLIPIIILFSLFVFLSAVYYYRGIENIKEGEANRKAQAECQADYAQKEALWKMNHPGETEPFDLGCLGSPLGGCSDTNWY